MTAYNDKRKTILCICYAIFLSIPVFSQGIINNGAHINQSINTYIVISDGNNGGYSANPSSSTNLNGDGIIMSGDLAISGNFNCGTCTLKFNGSSNQNLSTSGNTMQNIEVANNTGVTLQDNINIKKKLILSNGVISTGNNKVIMFSSLASDLIGGNNDSFIYGNLRRYFSQNTDTYQFPVGLSTNSSEYYQADFINNNLDLVGVDYLTVSVHKIIEILGDDEMINTTYQGTPIVNVYNEAEWLITPQSSSISSGTYGVNLWIDNITEPMYDNYFTVVKRSELSTSYADWNAYTNCTIPSPGSAGRTVSDGYAKKTGFSTFSKFAIGSGANQLPVELISFDAEEKKGSVHITWATNSESNNKSFTVEKSQDGWSFDDVSTIPGAGNSNERLEYSTIDHHPFKGISYYRLKQLDYDGKTEYSNMAPVFIKNRIKLDTWPNPANNQLFINLFHDKESISEMENDYLISIYNSNGEQAFNESTSSELMDYKLDISHLQPGMYFLQIQGNGESLNKNFIKQ